VSCRVGVGVMVSNATLNGIQRNCYLQKPLIFLALKSFDFECTWWRNYSRHASCALNLSKRGKQLGVPIETNMATM